MGGREKSDKSQLNRAYGCFAFLGLVTLPFGIAALLAEVGLVNFDKGFAEELAGWALYLGLILGIPLFAGMLVASVYGIARTVQFRHPPMVILSLISIVCGGGFPALLLSMGNGPDSPILDYLIAIVFGTYTAANVLIPAWWFSIGRRRYIYHQTRDLAASSTIDPK